MKAIIAEKPSVAREIAQILNANNKRDGYFEGNSYCVTWALSHLVSLGITADRVVLESTLSFTDVLTNVLMKKKHTEIKSIQLFWNQVDGREKTPLYKNYSKVIKDLGLQLMETSITDSKRFRKEGETVTKNVFRSSLLPADPKLMTVCRLDKFMDEFLKIVKL